MAVPLIALYFIDIEIPIEYITLIIGIGSIPWIIKFAWSGPIDKYVHKGRKFFVFIGGLIGAFSFFILYFIDPLNLIILFAIILFFSQIGQTLLDTAADAWAIDVSIDKDRGKINAAMNIGKIVGTILGAIVLTYIAQTFGHRYMFIIAGIMILISVILPSVIAETKKIIRKQKVRELFLKEFKKKYVKLLLLLIPLAGMGYGIFNSGIDIYAKNILELSDFQIGLLIASASAIAIPGSIFAGIISDKFGRKKAIYLFAIPGAIFVILMIFSCYIDDFFRFCYNKYNYSFFNFFFFFRRQCGRINFLYGCNQSQDWRYTIFILYGYCKFRNGQCRYDYRFHYCFAWI